MGTQRILYNLATDQSKGIVPGICKCLLFLLSLIYGLVVKVLIALNRSKLYQLPCKVISVGNITLGGTGKTALVEYLAWHLKQQGVKVAILSRGYKRKVAPCLPAGRGCATMGDEPSMLQQNLKDVPVVIDSNRIRSSHRAIQEYGVDTVILDDGFQQWKIKKDLEIVAIDATNPFGNYRLLPRGILREPLSSLKRAHIFVLTKVNLNPDVTKKKDRLLKINPRAGIFESVHNPVGFYRLGAPNEMLDLKILQSKEAVLFSGIADPASFENLLTNLGIKIGASFRYPDHHHYTQQDLENIIRSAADRKIDILITTEKDAARLGNSAITRRGIAIFVLRIEVSFLKNEEQFLSRLRGLYSL